ncbi:MAG: hypothetical protein SVU94_12000 [Bacteroidota bacterium]|nr:hypothetical protein [Bacteroidota bacterium]
MRHLLFIFACLYSFQVFSQDAGKYYQLELAIINAQYDSAIYFANQLLDKDSLDWKAHYYKGKSNLALNKYFEALENFQKANEIDSANYLIENSMAKIFDFTGQKEKAINIYYDQYLRDTNRLAPIENLAEIFRRSGEYSPAIHYYQKAIAINSTNFNYFKQLGYCLKQINLNQPAIYSYQNALLLNPYDLVSYKRLANLQNTEKLFDQAINTCQTGLKYYPEDIMLQKLLGYGYYLNKELDTAAIIFNEVIAKGDTSFFSLKYLGLTYFEMQQFEKAADILLQSVNIIDDDAEVLFFLGSAYGRYGEYNKGELYLNRALQVMEPPAKQVASIYEEFAYLYREMGKYELSVKYLKMAYRNSANPILSFKMGQLYDLYLDDKKLAIDYYDGYLTMANVNDSVQTDIVPLNTDEKELKEYVKNRIRQLEEEMFFEDAGE